MKLGVFTVALPDYKPLEAIDVLAELGYDGVEWRVVLDEGDRSSPSFWNGNRTSITADELIEKSETLKARAAERNVSMPSLGSYLNSDDDPEFLALNMKAAVAIGAESLRIGPGRYDPEGCSFAEQLDAAKDRYAKVAALAADHGVRALIETHMGLLSPTVRHTRALLEGLDPNHVGIMWDPGNQVYEGREVYEMAISDADEYLAEVHVKNALYRETGRTEDGTVVWEPGWCPLNEGVVQWPKVIAALKSAGYDGWLMLEDFSTEKPLLDRLRFDLDYLRGILKA